MATISTSPQLPEVWRVALEQVRARRSMLHYKPAALLVALDIIEDAGNPNAGITYDDFNSHFRKLLERLDPKGADHSWQPFFHLSAGDQIWDLYHDGERVKVNEPIEEPSRNYVENFANEARFKAQLSPFVERAGGRSTVRDAIYAMLVADGDPFSLAVMQEHRGQAENDAKKIRHWWDDHSEEIFWLEVTDRTDLGENLHAPQTDENGEHYWSYSFVEAINEGDIVYHFDKNVVAIVGRSVVTGASWEDEVLWVARGSSARSKKLAAHPRPGWYRGLERYERLAHPITLAAIREKHIGSLRESLESKFGKPLYFPFETGNKRPLRPLQGYIFKLPNAFLKLFTTELVPRPRNVDFFEHPGVGDKYRPAEELTAVAKRDPFAVDPTIVERGVRGHAITQNKLARHLRSVGIEPRSPTASEPDFDIAWIVEERTFVAEVKSITYRNEEKQLRLGLGQVLRYSYQLAGSAVPVLVAERRPRDPSWDSLCKHLGIILVWPEVFTARLAGTQIQATSQENRSVPR